MSGTDSAPVSGRMMVSAGPAVVSSKRKVAYRRSGWAVHEFEVWGGGALVCRAAALRMRGSLLLWVGGAQPALGELALGTGGDGAPAVALAGGGGGGEAAALARRLAAALRRPVWVALAAAAAGDRFSAPLLAAGLMAEIKNRPDFFDNPDERALCDQTS